ncbi:hypothetical protein [Xanthomonas vesicatoria]|uniref:Uncharacterized protein n=1 Tax=Xanthomonas vesicatoria TaxID=56460 RepID=A0AAJ0IYC1_9XANT|nr:hypothetical protein [Xanthomonas vesicatoria]APO95340.1 hypothetical protein BI313_12725 [Xanthomonas vesicatoria]KHM93176.1 hypothetical protein OR60_14530 [Xanthomonas vesicatoria]KHM94805.1 hypothetical protein OR61_10790 [Xanthomonas vesicatoria]MCC8620936.1 hypothetical protein [Xanthomonas vesicatoria]MCC8696237.1 hypothetical protein [Xanthomonas vesicatoria]
MIGSHLDALVGNDDAVMHDLFSATRQLLRIYEMPMTALFQLVEAIERRTGPMEDLSLGELLMMVGSVEVTP